MNAIVQTDIINMFSPERIINGDFVMRNFDLSTLNELQPLDELIPQYSKQIKDYTNQNITEEIRLHKEDIIMRLKLLTLFLALIATIQITLAGPFNANAKTKRIPAGTKLEMKLLTPLSTSAGVEGMGFSAMLITDQTADNDVILPMGSVVRGTIKKIVPARRMSKGSIIYMDFDHVVTPNGRQLPLSLNITGRTDLTYDGGITTTRGYGDAF